MTTRRESRVSCWLVTAAWLAGGVVLAAGTLPAEHFFRLAAVSNPKLSPDGCFVSMVLAAGPTNEHLVTMELGTARQRLVCAGRIEGYDWVSTNRLVVTAGGIHGGGMFAVNRDGSQAKVLIPSGVAQVLRTRRSLRLYDVLSVERNAYPNILVECRELDFVLDKVETTVRRLNVITGESKLVEKDPGGAVRFFVDLAGRVCLVAARQDDRLRLLHRSSGKASWSVVHESEDDVFPLALDETGSGVYVAARGDQDTLGLYRFDLGTRQSGDCLWRNARYDLSALLQDAGRRLLGVAYDADRLMFDWVDREAGERQQALEAVLPGRVTLPLESTVDGETTLLVAFGDRAPGTYYVYQRRRKKLLLLAEVAPWLRSEALAEMRPVRYRARDGLEIPAYLTLPLGASTNLPLVVMPHGGPWVRDSWGFDVEAQFLANRGYAVLQPNFRSSTGYGRAFEEAGYRQFGLRIQDDITDGVGWAVAEGIADPGRVAIFGASFGGYATMVGLTQTPELYRCGINYAGPVDLQLFLRRRTAKVAWRQRAEARAFARKAVMDYRKEKEALREVSPIAHVDRIRVPVMLVYGGADEVVDIEQGRLLEKELKRLGKTYEMVYEEEEGHGFRDPAALVRLHERMEAFLAEHLR